ncbi:MAG TPA: DUF5668 domain-containing protein [Holophagaceae bacterium]|jgi:hypothetical protein|nr:DUF5668 domain-containing protein [Holophagaceae bacterium]
MNDAFPSVPGSEPPRRHAPSLVLGICVILFGLALTLDQLNVPHTAFLVKLWPAILIALGAVKLRQHEGFSGGGFALVLIGAVLLVSQFSPEGLEDLLWPMLLVGLGIFLVTKSLRQRRGPRAVPVEGDGTVDATAIFSGCRRQPQGIGTFKGGNLTAIFGGIELDLRAAEPSPDPMTLDAFVLFGGGEIRVPPGWAVDIRTTSIFGGVANKIYEAPAGAGAPRLLITGSVFFGGFEVRH